MRHETPRGCSAGFGLRALAEAERVQRASLDYLSPPGMGEAGPLDRMSAVLESPATLALFTGDQGAGALPVARATQSMIARTSP